MMCKEGNSIIPDAITRGERVRECGRCNNLTTKKNYVKGKPVCLYHEVRPDTRCSDYEPVILVSRESTVESKELRTDS